MCTYSWTLLRVFLIVERGRVVGGREGVEREGENLVDLAEVNSKGLK